MRTNNLTDWTNLTCGATNWKWSAGPNLNGGKVAYKSHGAATSKKQKNGAGIISPLKTTVASIISQPFVVVCASINGLVHEVGHISFANGMARAHVFYKDNVCASESFTRRASNSSA